MHTPTVVEFSNERVLTTQQLAEVYDVERKESASHLAETKIDSSKENIIINLSVMN